MEELEQQSAGDELVSEEVVQGQTGDVEETFEPTSVADLFSKASLSDKNEPDNQVDNAQQELPLGEDPKQAVSETKTAPVEEPAKPSIDASEYERQVAGFKAGMLKERQKRQELEAQIQQQQQQQEQVYVDDEVQRYVQSQVSGVKQELQMAKINMSVSMAKQAYKDYEEKFAVFNEHAQEHPEVLTNVLSGDHPALAAYEYGKRLMFEKEYGRDPSEIEAKMENKLRAKLKKEFEAEFMGKVAAKSKQPTSLTSMRAAGGDSHSEWKPKSVDDLFGRS